MSVPRMSDDEALMSGFIFAAIDLLRLRPDSLVAGVQMLYDDAGNYRNVLEVIGAGGHHYYVTVEGVEEREQRQREQVVAVDELRDIANG